jgi:hypothetical protein
MARSIYFRHCDGEFKNALMERLASSEASDGGFKNALMQRLASSQPSDASRWNYQGLVFQYQVPGLEWKEGPKVQGIMIVDDVIRL